MRAPRGVLVLGVGLTTFLVVAAIVTALAAPIIEFSVFLGIPAGLLAGGIALYVVGTRLDEDASPVAMAVAAAIAVDGYAVLAGFAIRYAVASSRSILTSTVIGVLGVLLAITVGMAVWLRRR